MKRFWMILCMTVLLVMVLAVPAFAAEGHSHCLCNGTLEEGCAHSDVAFTPIASAADLTAALSAGDTVSVYLEGEITLESEIEMAGKTLNLCLNGNTIIMDGGRLTANGTTGVLNITDCNVTPGSIVGAEGAQASLLYTWGGQINLYAGTVDASKCASVNNGAVVYMGVANDAFTMYNGRLIGGYANNKGGVIYCNKAGRVSIKGGHISGGTAGSLGGAIAMVYGQLSISGGTITDCKSGYDTNGPGGCISIEYNATNFTLSGDAKIYGNDGVDVRLNGRDINVITLGDWQGNGEHGKLTVYKLTESQKKIVDLSADNVKADAATYFASSGNGYELVYDENSKTLRMGSHKHCNCLDELDHTHSIVVYQEVTTADAFKTAVEAEGTDPVNICITKAITLSSSVAISGKTVNLCLNGCTLTVGNSESVNYMLKVTGGGVLNITACNGGTIKTASATKKLIHVNSARLNLYGGTLDASAINIAAQTGGEANHSGAAVQLEVAGDTFNMYGGTILGGRAMRGGAVYVKANGTFTMSGGTIRGGNAALGGCVAMNRGTMIMTGGTITGGTATTSGSTAGSGGGVNVGFNAKKFEISGTAQIYGNVCDGQNNDVRIGINEDNDDFLTLGQWEGNGTDENGNARVLHLAHANATTAGYEVIRYATGVTNGYSAKSAISVNGYQLMATTTGMTVQASTAHIHCVCNGQSVGVGDHVCEDIIYTEVADTAGFTGLFDSSQNLTEDKAAYLTAPITLDKQYKANGHTLNICLHGQRITMSGSSARLTANAVTGVVNISSCTGSGSVLAGDGCKSGFLYTYNGRINLHSGTIDTAGKSIYAVRVDSNNNSNSVHMYGGTIEAGNTTGGAIYNKAGDVIIHGGLIEPNGNNKVIYVEHKSATPATFVMNGGSLSGGTVSCVGNAIVRGAGNNIASFSTLQAAATAAKGTQNVVTLSKALTESVTVNGNLYLDLNGFDVTGKVTMNSGKLYLIDKATADYAVDLDDEGNVSGGYGKITDGVQGEYAETFNTPKSTYGYNWKYLVLKDDDGALHAHRIYLSVSDVVLFPNTTSMKYKTVFYCDEVVAKAVSNYGVNFYWNGELYDESPRFVDKKTGEKLYGPYATSGDNSKLSLLQQVLTNIPAEEWVDRADMAPTVRACIMLNGKETPVLESAAKTVSFKQVVQEVLSWKEDTLSPAQKAAMAAMHHKYEGLLHDWCGGEDSQTLMHTDWLKNSKCACLGQYEGGQGHESCQQTYFVDVANAETFKSYFTWNEDSEAYELNADASLRLNGPVELTQKYNTNGHTLNIWLNDSTLKLSDSGRLTANKGGELSITEREDGTGRVDIDSTYGLYSYNGVLNLYNGYVDASNVQSNSAINVTGEFNMYGGTISGTEGETVVQGGEGSLIRTAANTVFNMYGGTITGGNSKGNGGNINVKGTMNMYGGTVENGHANANGMGGGNIYVTGASGKLLMSGGTIQNGQANGADTFGGSNVCVGYNSTFEMTGGQITNDEVSDYAYGGVCVRGNATKFSLSGDAKIFGHGVDVYLQGSKPITMGSWNGNGANGELCVSAIEGVTRMATFTSDVTDAAKTQLLERLTTNAEGYQLVLTDDKTGIERAKLHSHCICGDTHTAVADHTEDSPILFTRVTSLEQWNALFDESKVLKADTNVYIGENITLKAEYKTGGHTLNLCLGGKSITMNGGRLTANATTGVLNINACGDGKIVAAEKSAKIMLYTYNGKINLYGGTVDARNVNVASLSGLANNSGAAVNVNRPGDSLTIYGGTILGGTANRGGAVYVADTGAFHMHGGTISGGSASIGGCVALNKGSGSMTGGTITGGTATTSGSTVGSGGGVNIGFNAGSFAISGNAKIYGNTLNGNTNDVNIGIYDKNDDYLTLGQWAGNGTDENGNARVLNLTHANAKTAGYTVVQYAEGVQNGYAMKAYLDVAGYDLAATENGFVLQPDNSHIHCLCNGELAGTEGHTCVDVIFTGVDAETFFGLFTDKRLTANANVYLTEDVEISEEYKISGQTMNLCLGEHSILMKNDGNPDTDSRITANRASSGKVNGTLNLTACSDAGTITAESGCNSGVLYTWNGHINLYGGIIDMGGTAVSPIKVDTNGNGDTFTMYGGTINAGAVSAGAVRVTGGAAVMNGGLITAEGKTITANGGAVYVESNNKATGSFTMNGGQIVGGTANRGGAVYVNGGQFTMNGGTISDGKATTYGGNVAAGAAGSVTVNGGTIAGGEAAWGGGNLFLTGSNATVSGGTITAGKSNADGSDLENHFGGGNVCVGFESNLTVSGGQITGGICGMGREDVAVQPNSFATTLSGTPTVGKLFLVGKSLTIDNALTGGSVGVVLQSRTGELATGAGAVASKGYLSSVDGVTVTEDGSRLLLTEGTQAYMIGYGAGDITPSREDMDTGLQLQGFSNDAQVTNSSSTRGELLATAMAVTDDRGDTVLMISADACTVSESICNKLRLNISRETGLPVENIAISAAHQHSTPQIATFYYKNEAGEYTNGEGGEVVAEADRVIKTDYASTFYAGVYEAARNAMAAREVVTGMQTATVETKGKGDNGENFNYIRNVKYQIKLTAILGGTSITEVGMVTDNHKDLITSNNVVTVDGTFYSASYTPIGYESNVDHTMQLVKYTLAGGKAVILANFQTHPHLGANAENRNVHADIVGEFRKNLADENTDVIYFSGASGDVNPRDTYLDGSSYDKNAQAAYGARLAALASEALYSEAASNTGDWDVAVKSHTELATIRDDMAKLTAEEATAVLARAADIKAGTVAFDWTEQVEPYSNKALRLYSMYHVNTLLKREEALRPADGSEGVTTDEVDISAFSLGPVAVVNAPYEMFQENGQQIKGISVDANGTVTKNQRADGFDMIIVASKCNGSDGYIPTAAGYENGGYSTDVSWFVPGTGESLVRCYQTLLAELNPAN